MVKVGRTREGQDQHRHHQPGVKDGGVEQYRPPLPEHPLIRTEFQSAST